MNTPKYNRLVIKLLGGEENSLRYHKMPYDNLFSLTRHIDIGCMASNNIWESELNYISKHHEKYKARLLNCSRLTYMRENINYILFFLL